jgi:hypothetical protein
MTPLELLEKYKVTVRVRPCSIPGCGWMAHYWHETRGFLCSSHLLDLANIGEIEFKWANYEEVWHRTGIMLRMRGRKNNVKGE